MTSLFRPRNSFLQNNAWQNQALNALHYNTAQQGSVVPLLYGTMRQQVNVIDLEDYRGPKGKKGKSGSLPISGTSRTGKGGGSSKGKGSKKSGHYTVNVDFAVCQGPVTFKTGNAVYSSSGVETFSSSGLNFYTGADGQTADSHFSTVGYSGTCHVTGTPLDLGQSPVIPNIALEITGILAGVHTGDFTYDANPADVIKDFLTNKRYGAGFPDANLSLITHDDNGVILNTYGDYCQSAQLLISTSLDGHQKAIEWLNGIAILTNSALVWSGNLLKIVPYGDIALNANGMTWDPNWVYRYHLTDDDLLPWHPRGEGSGPAPGEDDPIVVTRTNPADADNWMSIEYTDRLNFYNSTTLTSFDQGAIDTYGLRIGDSLPGRAFASKDAAQFSVQLIMQRRLYIRNTGIRFQLGWQFALLEPMDLVTVTGRLGDNYLQEYPVRILSIEENDNGDLTIVAEDPVSGTPAPPTKAPAIATRWGYNQFIAPGAMEWPFNNVVSTDPSYDHFYGWDVNHPPDSPKGAFSVWINMKPPWAPLKPGDPARVPIGDPPSGSTVTSGDVFGLMRTVTVAVGQRYQMAFAINYDLAMYIYLGASLWFLSAANTLLVDGSWQHVLITWDMTLGLVSGVKFWLNGNSIENTLTAPNHVGAIPATNTVQYSAEVTLWAHTFQNLTPGLGGNFYGCTNHLWWDAAESVSDPGLFRNLNGTPKDLGIRGENPLGRPPNIYLHWTPDKGDPGTWGSTYAPNAGFGYYGINRAGYRCDDGAYWMTQNSSTNAGEYCDPAHPNFHPSGDLPMTCDSTSWK